MNSDRQAINKLLKELRSYMKKINIITSFNESYYNLIGKDCVGSFLKYWPENFHLTCYVEKMRLENHPRIHQISFDELPQSYFEFQQSDYKPRVKTFAKKGYSIIHAMENLNCDILIWIDSDVLTHAPITKDFLEKICSDKNLATFLGVWHEADGKNYFSCESSFFVVNKNHKNFLKFSKRYREYYDNRLTKNLRRFYDGEVLGATIKDLEELGGMCDLNLTGSKTPMPRSILKDFCTHFKAGLKDQEDLDSYVLKIVGITQKLLVSQ
jgi:hypothetical protein